MDLPCNRIEVEGKNTPFDGWAMLGKVRWTVSEGRVVYVGADPK